MIDQQPQKLRADGLLEVFDGPLLPLVRPKRWRPSRLVIAIVVTAILLAIAILIQRTPV